MASESSLWQWLRGARKYFGAGLHITRIENTAGVGAPDVEGMLLGDQFQLELKIASVRPARATTKLRFGSPLRESQLEWCEARLAAGGRVGYLIQVGQGTDRSVYLIPGQLARVLHEGVTESWCRLHNVLDEVTPAEVVRKAVTL